MCSDFAIRVGAVQAHIWLFIKSTQEYIETLINPNELQFYYCNASFNLILFHASESTKLRSSISDKGFFSLFRFDIRFDPIIKVGDFTIALG